MNYYQEPRDLISAASGEFVRYPKMMWMCRVLRLRKQERKVQVRGYLYPPNSQAGGKKAEAFWNPWVSHWFTYLPERSARRAVNSCRHPRVQSDFVHGVEIALKCVEHSKSSALHLTPKKLETRPSRARAKCCANGVSFHGPLPAPPRAPERYTVIKGQDLLTQSDFILTRIKKAALTSCPAISENKTNKRYSQSLRNLKAARVIRGQE